MISAHEIQLWNDQATALMESGEVERAFRLLSQTRERLSSCVLMPTPLREEKQTNMTSTVIVEQGSATVAMGATTILDSDQEDQPVSSSTLVKVGGEREQTSSPATFGSSSVQDDQSDSSLDEEYDEDDELYEMYLGADDCSVDNDIMMHLPDFYPYPFAFRLVNLHSKQEGTERTNPVLVLSAEQYNSCAVTCLFNQAVCCHLAWDDAVCPKEKQRFLLQARTLYEEALQLIIRNDLTCSLRSFQHHTAEGVAILKLLLAISVNALHCNTELCDAPEVTRWNHIRQCALNHATQFSQQHSYFQLWQSREMRLLQGFLSQVHLSRAPAA